MIKIKIYKDGDFIKRYSILGHANFDVYGQDIVCAAVSILGHTTLRSLVDVCSLNENEIFYKVDEETGFLDVKILIGLDDIRIKNTQVVFNTFIVGIKSLVESYPKHVTLDNRGGVINA